MSLLIVYFALGIILLALEIVTPGPLCGIAGCVCMVLGVVNAFGQFGPLGGTVAVALALAALATVIYLEFVWLECIGQLPPVYRQKAFGRCGQSAPDHNKKYLAARLLCS